MLAVLVGLAGAVVDPALSFVFYHRRNTPSHQRFLDVFLETADALKNESFAFLTVDVVAFAPPRLTALPAVHCHLGGEFLGAFDRAWRRAELAAFCAQCSAPPNFQTLQSSIDVLRFQSSSPVNVVVFAERGAPFADALLATLGARARLLPVAFAPSPSVACEVGHCQVPSLAITRPFDCTHFTARRYSRASLFRRLQPLIGVLNGEAIGDHIDSDWTLAVVLNRENASHWHFASKIFKHCAVVFGKSVSYRASDFFARPALAALLGVNNGTVPRFLAVENINGVLRERVYRENRVSPRTVRLWLREQMKAADRERKVIGQAPIPPIAAEDLTDAIEKGRLCVILIASLEAKHASLIKRFVKLKDARVAHNATFARFDPELQPAAGLSIAREAAPRIRVFAPNATQCDIEFTHADDKIVELIERCLPGPLTVSL
jgi:hypothetical protein